MEINDMYVYFITSHKKKNCPVKIGVSSNPEKRLLELQDGNPQLLTLIAKIPCTSKSEAYRIKSIIHDSFAQHNIRGDWFKGWEVDVKKAILKCNTYFKCNK